MKTQYRNLGFLGFPYHEVGSDGSVWSRLKIQSLGRGKGSRAGTGNVWKRMKPKKVNKYGHLMVELRNYPTCKGYLIHRLVLSAFVGPCPAGCIARHNPDPNPANNNLKNLGWGTPKQNSQDMVRHGNFRGGRIAKGEENPSAKLTNKQVTKIRMMAKKGKHTQIKIGQMFKVSRATIQNILYGKTWK